MLNARPFFEKLFFCYLFKAHSWTCAAIEGKPATQEQLEGGVAGFFDYAKTYCKRCEVESKSSKEAREKNGRS